MIYCVFLSDNFKNPNQNMLRMSIVKIVVILACISFYGCQKNKNAIADGVKFIEPSKIENLISDDYLIKNQYSSASLESNFDFNHPIALCEVKVYYLDSLYNENEPEEKLKISFNKFKKINTIEEESFKELFFLKKIYDTHGRLIVYFTRSEDKYENKLDQYFVLYDYFDNGNLMSKLSVAIENNTYRIKDYQEFEYINLKDKTLVRSKHIDNSFNLKIEKIDFVFDKKNRMISKNKHIIKHESLFKSSSSNTFYFYENKLLEDKQTRIVETYLPSNKKNEEFLKYDSKGYLIQRKTVSVLSDDIQTYKYKNNYSELQVTYDYFPKIKQTNVMGVVVENKEEHSEEKFVFDENKSIIKFKESIYTDKDLEYKYDENKNWLEKKIITTSIVTKELKKINPELKEEKFIKLYKRKINYKNFEPLHNKDIIDFQKIMDLKEKFLKDFEFEKIY